MAFFFYILQTVFLVLFTIKIMYLSIGTDVHEQTAEYGIWSEPTLFPTYHAIFPTYQ